jgi:hypothetical protein
MKKLILSSALGAAVMLGAACGDGADDATVDTAETDAMAGSAMADAGANADWPAGTRIVEEDGVTYRVNADGTRVELTSGDWRIVTEGEDRYRVRDDGTRIRIDEDGLDLDGVASGPDIPGVDVDVGTNADGNLDVDVNTEGRDATPGD